MTLILEVILPVLHYHTSLTVESLLNDLDLKGHLTCITLSHQSNSGVLLNDLDLRGHLTCITLSHQSNCGVLLNDLDLRGHLTSITLSQQSNCGVPVK